MQTQSQEIGSRNPVEKNSNKILHKLFSEVKLSIQLQNTDTNKNGFYVSL